MDIIKALKENEKPFGLMTDEMQDAARDNKGDKWLKFGYNNNAWGEIEVEVDYGDFEPTSTYRLRPDYKEEPISLPEVIECEIVASTGRLKYLSKYTKVWELIHLAPSCPDFIGFKYDESGYAYCSVRRYRNPKTDCVYTFWSEGREVLTPTHVLFRSSK